MGEYLLSICIPTFNRCVYLEKSILSLVNQNAFKTGQIEIVISDNASTDGTQEMVNKYCERYSDIKYFKNEENVHDKNFAISLGRGTGKLRKLCNDTLIFKENALNSMLKVIEKHKDDKPFIFWTNGNSLVAKNEEQLDFETFMNHISFWITSISCFSLWENQCTTISKDFDGCDTLLWQAKKTLEIACNSKNIVVENDILCSVQKVEKKDITYGLYDVFYENYFMLLNPYFESNLLSEETRAFLKKDLLYRFFMGFCVEIEMGNSNYDYSEKEDLFICIKKQYEEEPYWNSFLGLLKRKRFERKIKLLIKKVLRKEK